VILDRAAVWITLCGVVVVIASVRNARTLREGLAMGLMLWTAAGLLRLAASPDWPRIVVAAVVVVLRRVVTQGLARSRVMQRAN
jgi:hypothetical protein